MSIEQDFGIRLDRPDDVMAYLTGRIGEIRITPHSNMVYWWIVWVYGYICALAININHVGVQLSGKLVKFHPSAWVGLSFLLLVIFVILAVLSSVSLLMVRRSADEKR